MGFKTLCQTDSKYPIPMKRFRYSALNLKTENFMQCGQKKIQSYKHHNTVQVSIEIIVNEHEWKSDIN